MDQNPSVVLGKVLIKEIPLVFLCSFDLALFNSFVDEKLSRYQIFLCSHQWKNPRNFSRGRYWTFRPTEKEAARRRSGQRSRPGSSRWLIVNQRAWNASTNHSPSAPSENCFSSSIATWSERSTLTMHVGHSLSPTKLKPTSSQEDHQ